MSRSEIAENEGLTKPYVFKIAQGLIKAGLMVSTKGRHGGYGLARPADSITLADVYRALEGPLSLTPCDNCGRRADCGTTEAWQEVSEDLENALYKHTIAEMADGLRK